VKRLEAKHLDHFGLDLLCLNVRRFQLNRCCRANRLYGRCDSLGSRRQVHAEIASDASVAL
jgi:hypothetical protein